MPTTNHLAKARKLLDEGDSFGEKKDDRYRRAADEILAAKADDPSLSNRAIAKAIGRGHRWVNDLLTWATSGANSSTPFSPYSGKYEQQKQTAFKRAIREATPAQLRQAPPEALVTAVAEAGLAHEAVREQVRRNPVDHQRHSSGPAERKGQGRAPYGEVVSILEALTFPAQASQAASQMSEAIAGQVVDDDLRDAILIDVDEVIAAWKAVRDQLLNPVADDAAAFLAGA